MTKILTPTGWKQLDESRQSNDEILSAEHQKEAKRKRAKFTNLGWGTDEHGVSSKTSEGILTSTIDPKTKKVTHEWS